MDEKKQTNKDNVFLHIFYNFLSDFQMKHSSKQVNKKEVPGGEGGWSGGEGRGWYDLRKKKERK